jgi:aminopeptidase YwaD
MSIENMLKIQLFFLLFLSGSAISQVTDVRVFCKELCSPKMHGRGYVNGGDSIAAVYISKQFERVGLTPAPGQKDYYQRFSFPVNSFPSDMDVNLNGTVLRPGHDFIVQPSSGSFKGELKYRLFHPDEVFDGSSLKEFIQSIKVNGEFNAAIFDIEGLKGDSLKIVKGLMAELADYCQVVELVTEKFTWSVAQNATKFASLQMKKSIFLEGTMNLNITNKFLAKHQTQNVIGFLPAKKKTNKTIFLTAHYDHLGRMGTDTYFPGANDNASGTSMLLTLAEYFKQNPQKYNLAFVAFAGEEAGLLGSSHYVQNPIIPLKEIKFLLNLDIMGSGEEGVTIVNATLFPKAFKKLTKINDQENYLTQIKSRGPAANSDHYYFSENDVPAFFMYTRGPNKNYHDIFDQFEALSFAEYEDITKLIRDFFKKL